MSVATAPVAIGQGEGRVEQNGRRVIAYRLVVLIQERMSGAALVESPGIVRIEVDGLGAIRDGFLIVLQSLVAHAPEMEGAGVRRIHRDGRRIIRDRQVKAAQVV